MPSIKTAWYQNNWIVSATIIIVSFLVYSNVFTAHYAYLDDAWMIWHRTGNENYLSFASSGRLLTAIISQKTITSIDAISQLQIFRIVSLLGWIMNSLLLYFLSRVWVKRTGLAPETPFLLALLCICSSSVTVHIGWSICFLFFCGFFPALIAGHLLFLLLTGHKPGKSRIIFTGITVLVLGLISLLFYQSMYGIFLLPFLLWWLSDYQRGKTGRIAIAAALHLFTYACYFIFFQYYLDVENIVATDRAEMVFNPLKKIAFFFSTPFSQAWSLNHLVNAHNIISQLFPFLVFVCWLILYYRHFSSSKVRHTLLGLAGILFLLALSYLPSIAASQNYSPYRTMIALNLGASALLIATVLEALKKQKQRIGFITVIVLFNLFFSYSNFNKRFAIPLKNEYSSIISHPLLKNVNGSDTIIFIRPDAKIFRAKYGISSYKDEYGVPSTFRDWTPDPLIRQLIYERSSMEKANKSTILQFSSREHYADSLGNLIKNPVIFDMNEVIAGK